MAIVQTDTGWLDLDNFYSREQLDSGTDAWQTPENASADDTSYSTAVVAESSQWLIGWGLSGFVFSTLPSNAVPVGAEVRIKGFAAGGDAQIAQVTLLRSLGADFIQIGDIKNAADPIPATETTKTFGGVNDSWGNVGNFSRTNLINNGNQFGFAFFVENSDKASATASTNHMQIRFHYEYDDSGTPVLPWQGRKTIVESSYSTARPLNSPFQVNEELDAHCRYSIKAIVFLDIANITGVATTELWMGPTIATMAQVDAQQYDALINLGPLTLTLTQSTVLDFAVIVPAGYYVELRTGGGVTTAYQYISGMEQPLCVHDVYSIQWSTDVQDPATAPVTTSHRHIAELDVADELTIDQFKRDASESYRNLESPSGIPFEGNAYVRGTDLHLTGQRTLNDNGLVIDWLGTTYTESDSELTFPTPTTWEFIAPVGAETAGERFDISSLGGAIPKYATIIVDRTAPSAQLELVDMTVGLNSGGAMYRGEYARWRPTYSDDNAGIESATYQYTSTNHWNGQPSNATTSGSKQNYVRSSSSSPTSGNSDITLRIEDKAGNIATDTVSVFFGALPAQSSISVASIDSGNERPAHLNNSDYAQTSYDDNSISATLSITPALAECRNSSNDDTRAGIVDGTLKVSESYVNDVDGQTSVSDTVSIPNQSSGIGLNIKGQYLDQHYRTVNSATVGDFAFNQGRSNDFNGTDSSAGVPSLPFTGKAGQPYTDEFAEDSATNAQTVGGQVVWTSSSGSHETTITLAGNTGQRFRPRLFSTSGAEYLYATYSNDLSVEIFDGSNWVSPSAESFGVNADHVIPALNGTGSIQVRINSLTSNAPDISVLVINYIA